MYRAGFLGLIGQPNAGKSSLMNYLVNEKVSIVTDKPQTTRRRILGIASREDGQIVFVDAPGIIQAERGLNGFLAKEAEDVIANSDALLAVLSLTEDKPEDVERTLELVTASKKPWLGVITKTDVSDKIHRLVRIKEMIEKRGGKFVTVSTKRPQSAQSEREDKLDRELLLTEFVKLLPESPAPLYDVELFTNENVRNLAAEAIREKCFEFLHQEIPFQLAVRIIKFDEEETINKIYAEIVVAKENHKSIVIGKKAQMIKQIGTESRKAIEDILGTKVFLDLHVIYRDGWFDNQRMMKELGYVVESAE
ncbi:MAG TPA: GTPase Era [Pseudobdellovibrionaceae bacterium]|jgi:GTP-binding protein Era|nr:GTPase Era [Pseudobdellovibrionaceae bacterium]